MKKNNNNVSNKQKQKKWNSTKVIPIQHSVQMRTCYQIAGLRGKQLEQQFPQYARSTIYKHVNMPINDITVWQTQEKHREGWKNEFQR